MKISIVIPAHNEEGSIRSSVEAALAQDHPDFEVIVIDNASTDRTAEIAGRYPVKVVREERKGLLYARDRGRREAVGELVANMDADCLPDPTWLSRASRCFADERVVAVTGPYDYYDGAWLFRTLSLAIQKYGYSATNSIMRLLRSGGVLIGGNNLIRAGVLERMGGYDTSIAFYGEDTDTARRVSGYGDILFVRSLAMRTSARRFKSEGELTIFFRYLFFFVKMSFFPAGRRG